MPVPTAAAALRLLLNEASDACVRTLAAASLVEVNAADGPLSQYDSLEENLSLSGC